MASAYAPAGFLTISEAARQLGVCRATLTAWIDKGKIPYKRFPRTGGQRYVSKKEVRLELQHLERGK